MVLGTSGNDRLFGTTGDDAIDLLAGDDYYEGGEGLDLIAGGLGNDTLHGGGGSDYLFGGAGRDVMYGGADNDFFFNYVFFAPDPDATAVDIQTGEVFDGGEGFDAIFLLDPVGFNFAFGNATLASIEALTFDVADGVSSHAWFHASQVGQGLASNLLLFSRPGENAAVQVDFVMGAQTTFDMSGFTVGFANENDAISVIGDNDAETVTGSMGRDFLFGNGGNDTLRGGAGNDRLDGGAGIDTLAGGIGDDEYYVDNLNDQLVESIGEGLDTVYASTSYTLGAGDEIEVLRATYGASTANGVTLTGNEFANHIIGESGADTLNGGIGNDTLDGYYGNDVLNGGAGDDTASYQSVGGPVTVNLAVTTAQNTGLAGFDRLIAIENVTGSNFNDTLFGNALANILDGASGNDTLNGGAGNDTLYGGDGADQLIGGAGIDRMEGGFDSDVYYVDNALDETVEYAGQGTADRVIASVNYTLGAYDEIEYLSANSGNVAIRLTGNDFNNTIQGNAVASNDVLDGAGGDDVLHGMGGNDVLRGDFGNDTLNGGDGDDRLIGGSGNDILTGGAGRDAFVLDTYWDLDRITDFSVANDKILLEDVTFGLSTTGVMSAAAFRIGTAAQDSDDRFIYNPANGGLFWDPDGNGMGTQVRIATLSTGLALTNANFEVI